MKTCGECDGILVVFPLDSTTKHAFCDDEACSKMLGDSGTAWTCDGECDFDLCSDCYGDNGVAPLPEGNVAGMQYVNVAAITHTRQSSSIPRDLLSSRHEILEVLRSFYHT